MRTGLRSDKVLLVLAMLLLAGQPWHQATAHSLPTTSNHKASPQDFQQSQEQQPQKPLQVLPHPTPAYTRSQNQHSHHHHRQQQEPASAGRMVKVDTAPHAPAVAMKHHNGIGAVAGDIHVPYFVEHLFHAANRAGGVNKNNSDKDGHLPSSPLAASPPSSSSSLTPSSPFSFPPANLASSAPMGSVSMDLEHDGHDHSQHAPGHCRSSMRIENSHCDYDAVESVNLDLGKQLQWLVNQKYFKFYKLNLYGVCPYWTENHFCMNEDCSVSVLDEKNIPEEWTSKALGAISSPSNGMLFQPFKSCNLKDQDFCQVDDESQSEGVYVDLTANPERFTGYSGPSAAKVWSAIYDENCFNVAQKMQLASNCEQCTLDRAAEEESKVQEMKKNLVSKRVVNGLGSSTKPWQQFPNAAAAPQGGIGAKHHNVGQGVDKTTFEGLESMAGKLEGVLKEVSTGGHEDQDICLEKRVFYRLISGLHASISVHICDEYLNQSTGIWGPNLECFISRVGNHPDRIENIYFDYSILLRAVTKLSGYLKSNEFCTGDAEQDAVVKGRVTRLIEKAGQTPAIFDEKAMFVGGSSEMMELKMEFRNHFRNITKIMDCVGCEKCRLWGKVQTSGLGTALKVLFSYNDEYLNPKIHPNLLQRTEIVALFNTLNRFSESVEAIGRFRDQYVELYGIPSPSAWNDIATSPAAETAMEEQDKIHDEDTDQVPFVAVIADSNLMEKDETIEADEANVESEKELVETTAEPTEQEQHTKEATESDSTLAEAALTTPTISTTASTASVPKRIKAKKPARYRSVPPVMETTGTFSRVFVKSHRGLCAIENYLKKSIQESTLGRLLIGSFVDLDWRMFELLPKTMATMAVERCPEDDADDEEVEEVRQ